jgi:23S rRNA pseudouridine2457 synthase
MLAVQSSNRLHTIAIRRGGEQNWTVIEPRSVLIRNWPQAARGESRTRWEPPQSTGQAGTPFYPPGVLIAFNKPYGVLSQFTADGSPNRPLAGFDFPKDVYAIGRLDADSEGLLLLSDEPEWNAKLLEPRHAHEREYWAQVERIPDTEALEKLARGVVIQGRKTLPCRAWLLDPQPQVPPRQPPIRFRKSVPDCWIGLELIEGKNRQVRRMTAAIGHPTLRLLRVRIGSLTLGELPPGQWRILQATERKLAAGE